LNVGLNVGLVVGGDVGVWDIVGDNVNVESAPFIIIIDIAINSSIKPFIFQ
jgi:hypothetical protein